MLGGTILKRFTIPTVLVQSQFFFSINFQDVVPKEIKQMDRENQRIITELTRAYDMFEIPIENIKNKSEGP